MMPWLDQASSNPAAPSNSSVITIRELSCRGLTQRGTRQWSVTLTTDDRTAAPRTATLTDPFNKQQDLSLKWALEDYPTQSPFELTRAQTVEADIQTYGLSLITELQLRELLVLRTRLTSTEGAKKRPVSEPPQIWILDIEAYEEKGRFHNLHWEVLEHPSFWTGVQVIVRRKLHSQDLLTHGRMIAVRSPTFRILMVVGHSMSTTSGNGRKSPHPRLHSRPLVDLVEEIKQREGGAVVTLEVVRPATWKALNAHLELRGKGYFHLLHFDVHARWDDTAARTELAFISDNSTRKRSWRDATEISALVTTHSIKIVVLNAQRSSAAFGVCESSLAEKLVEDGVRAVVAMPYKVQNAGSEIMMREFYRELFAGSWDLSHALAAARKVMMGDRIREGRFEARVEVMDWIAPVLYHNGGTEVALSGAEITPDSGNGGSIFSRLMKPPKVVEEKFQAETEFGNLVGREGDIFDIETRFLGEHNILRLHGAPGVGKSALVAHLCWWWRVTSLVTEYFYFDCYQRPLLNVEMVCRQLYLTLFPPAEPGTPTKSRSLSPIRDPRTILRIGNAIPATEIFPENWMQLMTAKLRETPYLIVLDSLDGSQAMNEGTKQELNDFLLGLLGGRSLVVLVSNRKHGLIYDSLKVTNYHLKGLEVNQAVELGTQLLSQHGDYSMKFEGPENQVFLEKILRLCDNNPLVMELALPHLAQRDESPQEMYIDMLQSFIPLGTEGVAEIYNTKSMRAVTDMYKRLDAHSKQLLLCLAPFWSVVPKDINLYFMCLIYHKVVAPERADVRQSVANMWHVSSDDSAGLKSPTVKVESMVLDTGLEGRYERLVSELLALDLFTETPDCIEGGAKAAEQFYGIHPLLTLFLRQRMMQAGPETINPDFLRRTYLDYYSQRSTAWDVFPDQAYTLSSREFRNEEQNFLSCLAIPFTCPTSSATFRTFPIHIFVRLCATVLVDPLLAPLAPVAAYFGKHLLKRFETLRLTTRAAAKTATSPLTIAMFAAEWLCEYHGAFSGPTAFMASVENSLQLAQLCKDTNPGCVELVSNLQEQCCKQKAWAASGGMMSGIRLRYPFAHLLATPEPVVASSALPRSPAATTAAIWSRLATSFLRLHSLAIQAQLCTFLPAAPRAEIRKDLKTLWLEALKSLQPTLLEPVTRSYPWVLRLLSARYTPLPSTPLAPPGNFTAYPAFLRTQLYLRLRDPSAARKTLDAATKSPSLPHALLHLRLATLTHEAGDQPACLTHLDHLCTVHSAYPDAVRTRADHLAHAALLLLLASCQPPAAATTTLVTAQQTAIRFNDTNLQYRCLRELAILKHTYPSVPTQSVVQLTFAALKLSYARSWRGVEERGVLLREVAGARECVDRVCEMVGEGGRGRVQGFLEMVGGRAGEFESAGDWKGAGEVWRDVEAVVFGIGGMRRKGGERWRGTVWEGGVWVWEGRGLGDSGERVRR